MKSKISTVLMMFVAVSFVFLQACEFGAPEPVQDNLEKKSQNFSLPFYGTMCGLSSAGTSCSCGTVSETLGNTLCRQTAGQSTGSKRELKCWSGKCACTTRGSCGLTCIKCPSANDLSEVQDPLGR